METQKITLQTAVVYEMTIEELKTMFVYQALNRFLQLRTPDYDEITLLKLLYSDLRRKYKETQKMVNKETNNKIISVINRDLEYQFNQLKKILTHEGVNISEIRGYRY